MELSEIQEVITTFQFAVSDSQVTFGDCWASMIKQRLKPHKCHRCIGASLGEHSQAKCLTHCMGAKMVNLQVILGLNLLEQYIDTLC